MNEKNSFSVGYRTVVTSLDALKFAWISHAGRKIGGPPITNQQWADCIEWLCRLARVSDSMAQLVNSIGLPPLYQTKGEVAAKIYRSAYVAMQEPYTDVIGRSMPDASGRPSSYRRDWTLREKILVIAYLKRATSSINCTAPGYGWALEELAKEEGVILPNWSVEQGGQQ